MLNNHTYNLLNQLTQEHKSLWRIKNQYLNDTEGCDECNAFWNKMMEEKEKHITELQELIKTHLK